MKKRTEPKPKGKPCELCGQKVPFLKEVSWRDGTLFICSRCDSKTKRRLERRID